MRKVAIVVVVSTLLAGCGTVMHGTHQDISISSNPAGAKVMTSAISETYTTPATLTLERNHEYTLTFTKDGYTPATLNIRKDIGPGTLIADVLLGLVGVVIDAVTGAWYGLNPESATVTLSRVGGSDTDADAIRIAVVTTKETGRLEIRSETPSGVSFRLKRR